MPPSEAVDFSVTAPPAVVVKFYMITCLSRVQTGSRICLWSMYKPAASSCHSLVMCYKTICWVYAGTLSWEALLAAAADVPPSLLLQTEAALQFDAPAQIQYTSGTTGKPKGVTLSHHSLLNNGYFIGESNLYSEQDKASIAHTTRFAYKSCLVQAAGNASSLDICDTPCSCQPQQALCIAFSVSS